MKYSIQEQYIKINLVGGLGNQLFTYFAGVYKSEIDGKIPILNLGELYARGTNHGVFITEFELPFAVVTNVDSLIKSQISRVLRFLIRKGLLSKNLINQFTGHFQSSEIGFDASLERANSVREISGYFQSHKYFDLIRRGDLKRLSLLNPSDWYNRKSQKLGSFNWIALHVRRGDFKQLASTVGLLDANYYLEGVNLLDSKLESSLPIVVFSDDIDEAREILKPISARVIDWVTPPAESAASESLMLMSQATALVIANSTFSWWGAKLSTSNFIVAPSKWFKNAEDPKSLYSDNWFLLESNWSTEFSV
jgi:hypothetical protein